MKLSDRVKSLVDAKKYDDAIELLASVNNPKATDWIKRIEALQGLQKKKDQQRAGQVMVWIFFACILSCAVIWIWGSLFPEKDPIHATERRHIIQACASVMSVIEAIDNCNADSIIENHPEAVAFCEQHYDENNPLAGDLHAVCLKMEGVDMGF